jgi:PKD repeat protein
MRVVILVLNALLCALLVLCAACAGSPSATPPQPGAGSPSLGLPLALPAPAALQRSASAASMPLRYGQDMLDSEHLQADGPQAARYCSTWGEGHMTAADIAYGIYALDTNGYTGDPAITLQWNEAPAENTCFIGLGNFARNRWDWFPLPASEPLAVDPATYIDGSGTLLLAVVVLDSEERTLDFARVGGDLAPHAQLAADHTSGAAPLDVILSGSASSDPEGAIVKYEFDPLGDGTWVDNAGNPDYPYTYTASGAYTAHLRVTDSAGQTSEAMLEIGLDWQHSWGGADYDEGTSVAVDNEGNLIVLALTTSFGQGANENLIMKYNPRGELLWQKTFGTANGDSPEGLVLDADGNIYVGSSSYNPATFYHTPYVYSLTPDGTLRWQKIWNTSYDTELAGIAVDSQGSYYFTAAHIEVLLGDADNMYIKGSTSDGSQTWAREWGGSYDEYPRALALDEDGNGYIAVNSNSYNASGPGGGPSSSVLICFSPDGSIAQCYAFGQDEALGALSVSAANGHIYFTTYTVLASISEAGALEWQATLNLGSWAYYVNTLPHPGGCYLVATIQNPVDLTGVVADFDEIGDLAFTRLFGATGTNCAISGIAAGPAGGLYFTGRAPDASPAWWAESPTPSSPAYTLVALPTTSTAISTMTNADFWGTLADVAAGAPVIDTGGGGDDACVGYFHP